MRFKGFVTGAAIGIALGFLAKDKLTKQTITPEKALRLAKSKLKEIGPISGSWIHMVPETFSKGSLTYKVYRGGISRNLGDEVSQFEFIVDTQSGAVIECTPL